MVVYGSAAVRVRDDLRGGVPAGAAVRAHQQRAGDAAGRQEVPHVLPPARAAARQRHRRLVPHPRLHRQAQHHHQRENCASICRIEIRFIVSTGSYCTVLDPTLTYNILLYFTIAYCAL